MSSYFLVPLIIAGVFAYINVGYLIGKKTYEASRRDGLSDSDSEKNGVFVGVLFPIVFLVLSGSLLYKFTQWLPKHRETRRQKRLEEEKKVNALPAYDAMEEAEAFLSLEDQESRILAKLEKVQGELRAKSAHPQTAKAIALKKSGKF